MKTSAQTVTWFIFLALIKNYSCAPSTFTFPILTLEATEGSCIEIECKVPDPDYLNTGYWFWMKNAVWNGKDFDATTVYSSDNVRRTVDPVFDRRVTKTPDKNPSPRQCNILICDLNKNDSGNYSVRHVDNYDKKWKTPNHVKLTVKENPCPLTFEKPPVVNENETVTLTCFTLSSCSDLLIEGKQFDSSSMKRQEEGETKSTTVSFKASWKDDQKKFSCRTRDNKDKYLTKEQTATVEYAPKEIKADTNTKDIQEGQSVTFNCSANGRPEPNITWFFNNDHKQSWSNQIESIQRSQSGEYHCVAQNKHGSLKSSKTTVNVQHAPQVDVKTDSCASPHCVLKEKDRIALTCKVINANPEPTDYFWYKNGIRLSLGIRYEKVINHEDSGEYTCGAENTVGTGKSKALNLEVHYTPRETLVSAGENVKIGQNTVLTCETDAKPAPFSYTWGRYNEKQWSSRWNTTTVKTLILQRVQREDDACYTCTARNSINTGPSSPQKCIRVLYPPTNLLLSMETEAQEGRLLTISCSVESFPVSQLSIEMGNEGHRLSTWTEPRSKIYETPNKLQFTINVTSAHTGVYSCHAWNAEGSKESQQKTLVVKYRPKDVQVQAKPGLVVTENASLTLNCTAQSHPPVTSFIWMKVKKERDEPIGTKTQTITVKSVSPSDSGLYRCAASNEMGTGSSQQVEVKVKYAPKHTNIKTVSTSSQQRPDGKTSVTLSCSSHSYPPPTYLWYKKTDDGERELSQGQTFTVNSDQPGVYSCIAKNEVNRRSSDPVVLFVDNFPMALKLLIPFLIILLIIVLVFFVLRHRRSKSVQRGTENTPPRSGFLCCGNYARRRSLMNTPCMSEPSQSRDDLLPDQPCRPNPQHHHARPDSTTASNIASVYATVNLPAGKQASSAPEPAGPQAGNSKDIWLNYASLQFAKRPKDKQKNGKEPDAVYAVVSKKKSLETNEEEMQKTHDYENVTVAPEVKSPDPWSSETSSTSSTSSDSSDNEVELNYSQVSFKAKPGRRRPPTDSSSSEDEERTQYSQVKM
ncbi:uncharacterized protein V6R79_019286 [Siganus canaliculatus]